jgi:hypothetical protein
VAARAGGRADTLTMLAGLIARWRELAMHVRQGGSHVCVRVCSRASSLVICMYWNIGSAQHSQLCSTPCFARLIDTAQVNSHTPFTYVHVGTRVCSNNVCSKSPEPTTNHAPPGNWPADAVSVVNEHLNELSGRVGCHGYGAPYTDWFTKLHTSTNEVYKYT